MYILHKIQVVYIGVIDVQMSALCGGVFEMSKNIRRISLRELQDYSRFCGSGESLEREDGNGLRRVFCYEDVYKQKRHLTQCCVLSLAF